MMLFQWFKHKSRRQAIAQGLYQAALAQSRCPDFYAKLGVADTTDGHFDMLSLHISLLINRLNDFGKDGQRQGQALFDAMFRRMELDLREMGVGDLGVPKHMKRMMTAFHGRAKTYHEILKQGDVPVLEAALTRNIFKADGQSIGGAKPLGIYTMAMYGWLGSLPMESLTSGSPLSFPPIEAATAASDDVRRSA